MMFCQDRLGTNRKKMEPFCRNKIAFCAGIDPVGLPLVAFGADEELLLRVWLWMAVTALLIKFLLLDGERERFQIQIRAASSGTHSLPHSLRCSVVSRISSTLRVCLPRLLSLRLFGCVVSCLADPTVLLLLL